MQCGRRTRKAWILILQQWRWEVERIQVRDIRDCAWYVQHWAEQVCCPVYSVTEERGKISPENSQRVLSSCTDAANWQGSDNQATTAGGHNLGYGSQQCHHQSGIGGCGKEVHEAIQFSHEELHHSLRTMFTESQGQARSVQQLGMDSEQALAPWIDPKNWANLCWFQQPQTGGVQCGAVPQDAFSVHTKQEKQHGRLWEELLQSLGYCRGIWRLTRSPKGNGQCNVGGPNVGVANMDNPTEAEARKSR